MNKYHRILTFMTCILCQPVLAADYCVTNAQELQDALNQASNSAQSNHIKLVSGTYLTTDNGQLDAGFTYTNIMPAPLTISGGWSLSTGGTCFFVRVRDSAFETVLSGGGEDRVLHIAAGLSGTPINISNLSIINGKPNSPTGSGGGLLIRGFTSQDLVYSVLLDRLVFAGNEANYSSALSINSGHRVDVKNSLFMDNTVNISYTATISTDSTETVYFTNNTVINNDTLSTNGMSGTLLRNFDSGGVVAANNIFWNNQLWDMLFSGTSANHHLINNLYQTATGNAGIEIDNITTNPLFNPDYTLKHNSPAIDAGLTPPDNLPNPPVELDWTTGELDLLAYGRNQGNSTDMGAFEFLEEIFWSGFD